MINFQPVDYGLQVSSRSILQRVTERFALRDSSLFYNSEAFSINIKITSVSFSFA